MLRAVNERVRHENSEEHGKLLEAQAELDALQEHCAMLARQNSVLVRSAEGKEGAASAAEARVAG